jgi:hypothetical protein
MMLLRLAVTTNARPAAIAKLRIASPPVYVKLISVVPVNSVRSPSVGSGCEMADPSSIRAPVPASPHGNPVLRFDIVRTRLRGAVKGIDQAAC